MTVRYRMLRTSLLINVTCLCSALATLEIVSSPDEDIRDLLDITLNFKQQTLSLINDFKFQCTCGLHSAHFNVLTVVSSHCASTLLNVS